MKVGPYLNLKRNPPVMLGGDENKGDAPDEGIMIFDDDIDTEEGSATDGELIYEKQPGTIDCWTSSREDRQKLKLDVISIIENSGENVIITSIKPVNYLDYHAFELSLRRCI